MTDTAGNDVAVSPRLQHMRCTLGGVMDQRERSEIAVEPIATSQLAVDRCQFFFSFGGGGGPTQHEPLVTFFFFFSTCLG